MVEISRRKANTIEARDLDIGTMFIDGDHVGIVVEKEKDAAYLHAIMFHNTGRQYVSLQEYGFDELVRPAPKGETITLVQK